MATRRRKKSAAPAIEAESPRGDSEAEQEQGELPTEDDPFEQPPPDEFDEQVEDEATADTEPPVAAKPASADRTPADRRMPPPWGNVITDVFNIDIEKTYKRLTEELALGGAATQYATVLSALDVSARNAFDAVRLSRAAKRTDEDVSREIDERLEVLRTTARELLETEKAAAKKAGGTVKAPTVQEIKDRMIATWPDEMQSLESRKSYMHGAFRSIEGLEKAWWDRCQSLRKIADRFTARS